MSPVESTFEAIATLISLSLFSNIFTYIVAITLYVLGSLGMYTIAKRRQIKYPWMAWVPLLNLWILGSISDQYQYVVKEKVRNSRKWLIGLAIAVIVIAIVMFVMMFVSYFQALVGITGTYELETLTEEQILTLILNAFVPTFIVLGVYFLVAAVLSVLQLVCYYRLFASCNPEHKGLFLVLGIFLNFLLPIFTFACRNQDLGMPPRNDQPAAYIPQPQPTAEPWNQPQQPNNL